MKFIPIFIISDNQEDYEFYGLLNLGKITLVHSDVWKVQNKLFHAIRLEGNETNVFENNFYITHEDFEELENME